MSKATSCRKKSLKAQEDPKINYGDATSENQYGTNLLAIDIQSPYQPISDLSLDIAARTITVLCQCSRTSLTQNYIGDNLYFELSVF